MNRAFRIESSFFGGRTPHHKVPAGDQNELDADGVGNVDRTGVLGDTASMGKQQ
jgi:hypothetical protein